MSLSTERHVEKFLKKLAGMTDLEDALKRLDTLTQEEARMALAEILRITQSIHDKVQGVDERVQVVMDGALWVSSRSSMLSDIYTFRRQGNQGGGNGNKINCIKDSEQRRRDYVFVIS